MIGLGELLWKSLFLRSIEESLWSEHWKECLDDG